jgi:hypothetical protein
VSLLKFSHIVVFPGSDLVNLDRRSHETFPPIPAPTPPAFHLDFAQLLQATAAKPTSRIRPSATSKTKRRSSKTAQMLPELEEEGWHLVDDEEGM